MIRFAIFIAETENNFIPKEHRRNIKLKSSPHSGLDVYGEFRSGKKHTVKVHYSKLHATQKTIDKRWKSGVATKGESDLKEHPTGVRTKEGHVHLLDGHHRGEHAHTHKQHLHVDVVDVDHVRPYAETRKLPSETKNNAK